jgi:hypothetical protein
MRWIGKKNGELLKLVMKNNFELFLTVDRNLPHQQNLDKYTFSLIVIEVINNRLETIRSVVPAIIQLIESGSLKKLNSVSPD